MKPERTIDSIGGKKLRSAAETILKGVRASGNTRETVRPGKSRSRTREIHDENVRERRGQKCCGVGDGGTNASDCRRLSRRLSILVPLSVPRARDNRRRRRIDDSRVRDAIRNNRRLPEVGAYEVVS